MFEPDTRISLATLAGPSEFRATSRFACGDGAANSEGQQTSSDDPFAAAYANGFAEGAAQARTEAEAASLMAANARGKLALSFARLDRALEQELRVRLRETVAALCNAALAPLAIDNDALVRRVDKAVSMLARADDERSIRLHPDDIAEISDRFREDWTVQPDPTLERGALRVESTTGGIEDGPATWRRAIAETLHRC